ncbi:response regulator [Pedobacter steynii]
MKTVLIIEDNADIRESCSEILELSGYKVFAAENGKTGIELASQHKPDVILCDIMMPELDGFGVLFLLSKNPATSEIPFIFLTARTERVDFRKAMEMGADDYLTKPFNDLELLHAIETRINKSQRQKDSSVATLGHIEKLSLGSGNGMKELKELIAGRKIKRIKKSKYCFTKEIALRVYIS